MIIQNLISKKEAKREINTETIYCTKAQKEFIWEILTIQKNVSQDNYINDGNEVDEKKMKLAISLLNNI